MIATVIRACASRHNAIASLESAVKFLGVTRNVHDIQIFAAVFTVNELNLMSDLEKLNRQFVKISSISHFDVTFQDMFFVKSFTAARIRARKFRFLMEDLMAEHQSFTAVHFSANVTRPLFAAINLVFVHVFSELRNVGEVCERRNSVRMCEEI